MCNRTSAYMAQLAYRTERTLMGCADALPGVTTKKKRKKREVVESSMSLVPSLTWDLPAVQERNLLVQRHFGNHCCCCCFWVRWDCTFVG